ncbi:hypothetical protein DRO69_10795 [Candidatus Bathyarchaeota archaeon]|nr:MAG: hypothetical protein DRO69_10795 [Candidatus Bathyarchaeota archaeon]
MKPIPWRYVSSWNCIACGMCCKSYEVVISFPEWINIVRSYGVGVTKPSINKFHLKRRKDGSCVFLYRFFDRWLCSLQNMKPIACKLWPFKILDKPRFGGPNEAFYNYGDRRLFIYVDPLCRGIRWGNPTQEFACKTMTELVEIALGRREKQYYSTSKISYRPAYFGVRGRKII